MTNISLIYYFNYIIQYLTWIYSKTTMYNVTTLLTDLQNTAMIDRGVKIVHVNQSDTLTS